MTAATVRAVPSRLQSTATHVAGLAVAVVGLGIALSALVEVIDGGPDVGALALSALIDVGVGVTLWRTVRPLPTITHASAFATVGWTWVAASAAGAVPFVLTGALPAWDDALFESVSGFTATGSTVLVDIEANSAGVLFWRQLTQWIGGMGMVVLAVAVLPFLGVGGLELIAAEAPGEGADRLAPHVRATAARLWLIYLGFTVVIAVALLIGGLSLYDSLGHAFTTVATGGFSTNNLSAGHYDSPLVESILIVGMVLCGGSFTVHAMVLARRRPGLYWANREFRLYLMLLGGGVVAVVGLLVADGEAFGAAVRDGVFNVATLGTSTGFANLRIDGGGNFDLWGSAPKFVLLFFMVSGGMTGSTSGGIKVLRVDVLVRVTVREIRRLAHPRAALPIRQHDSGVPERVVSRMAGFVLLYLALAAGGVVVLMLLGTDLASATGAAVSAIGNMGPGFNDTGPAENFLAVPRLGRAVLMWLMLVGRLEVFAMLLMFTGAPGVLRSLRR